MNAAVRGNFQHCSTWQRIQWNCKLAHLFNTRYLYSNSVSDLHA